jgi:hypothetical protein
MDILRLLNYCLSDDSVASGRRHRQKMIVGFEEWRPHRVALADGYSARVDLSGVMADDGMKEKGRSVRKGKPGRKPVEGKALRKFLATLEAETIKGLKYAAIQEGTTASQVLEKAAAEWLGRRKVKAVK